MFVCDGFNLDLNMKLKTDNQNFNKKIIMKKLVLVVAMFMFACGSFFTMAQDPVKKDPKKEVKDTAKTEPKKEVAAHNRYNGRSIRSICTVCRIIVSTLQQKSHSYFVYSGNGFFAFI